MAGFPDSGSVPVRKYTPDAADSSRASTPSNSLRGPATALPVQFDNSAVRSLLGSPWTRKILIVAVGMRGIRITYRVLSLRPSGKKRRGQPRPWIYPRGKNKVGQT